MDICCLKDVEKQFLWILLLTLSLTIAVMLFSIFT